MTSLSGRTDSSVEGFLFDSLDGGQWIPGALPGIKLELLCVDECERWFVLDGDDKRGEGWMPAVYVFVCLWKK